MIIESTRFGHIEVSSEDVIRFPFGLFGLEDCREWILLGDSQEKSIGWMQSVSRPDIALAVVSPRRFVPGYQVRVCRAELAPLGLEKPAEAEVLVIVGRNDRAYTLNLKAPLILHPARRLGRQVVTSGDLPLQYELPAKPSPMKRIA